MIEFIRNLIYPSPIVILGFVFMLMIDLITGVRKAKRKGEATTSKGLRRTVDKSTTYFTLIISLLIIFNLSNIANLSGGFKGIFSYSINGVIGFCIMIEFKSILENLIEINKNENKPNLLCEKLLIPLHNIVILKFK